MTTDGKLRVAAIGDLHVMEDSVAPYRELFAEISSAADVLVLCGDLTNFGKTKEAEILADRFAHAEDGVAAEDEVGVGIRHDRALFRVS